MLPFWVAEMDVRLAEPIWQALAELIERSELDEAILRMRAAIPVD